MTTLPEIESRIVELCERARDELGWKFTECTYQSDSNPCGCVLEACAAVLGKNKSEWLDFAEELGLSDGERSFGHFDYVVRVNGRNKAKAKDEEEELAERLARRFVEGVE